MAHQFWILRKLLQCLPITSRMKSFALAPSLPGHRPPATLQLGDFCAQLGDQLILVCPGHADVATEAPLSREPTGFRANPDGSSSDLPVN